MTNAICRTPFNTHASIKSGLVRIVQGRMHKAGIYFLTTLWPHSHAKRSLMMHSIQLAESQVEMDCNQMGITMVCAVLKVGGWPQAVTSLSNIACREVCSQALL